MNNNKRYMIGSSYLFVPKKYFRYKNSLCCGVGLDIVFTLSKNNKPILHSKNSKELLPVNSEFGEFYSDLVSVYYDEDEFFDLRPNIPLSIDLFNKGYSLVYKIIGYWIEEFEGTADKVFGKEEVKDLQDELKYAPVFDPREMSNKEFNSFIKKYGHYYCSNDNMPTQVPAFFHWDDVNSKSC